MVPVTREVEINQTQPDKNKLQNDSTAVKSEDSQKKKKRQRYSAYRHTICDFCLDDEYFETPDGIIEHWTKVHGLRPSNCSVCDALFPTISDMFDHKVEIHGIPCALCESESYFETLGKLREHVKVVHLIVSDLEKNGEGEGNEDDATDVCRCQLCPKTFKDKETVVSEIKHHWRKTHGVNPILCGYCDLPPLGPFVLKRKDEIKIAMDGGVTCDSCAQIILPRPELEDHLTEVEARRLLKHSFCIACCKIFPEDTVACLEIWRKKKAVDYNYPSIPFKEPIRQCKKCTFYCSTEEIMTKHMELEHGPRVCSICGKVSANKALAKYHRLSVHKCPLHKSNIKF